MLMVTQLYNWLHVIDYFSLSFATVFNLFLIFVVLRKSPSIFGYYKYLMVFISTFEIIYSFLDSLIVPIHYSYRSVVGVFINNTGSSFTPNTLNIMNGMYWGFFGASMAIFAVHFIYRYLVISGHSLLSSFNSWKILLWFLIPMSFFVIWMATGLFLCGPRPMTTEFLRKDIMETFNENIENFSYLGVFMYHFREDGSIEFHWIELISMTIMSVIISVSFAIILIFGNKCYNRIRTTMKTTSFNNKNLQSQLFNALVFQTLIPTFLMHIPVALKFGFAMFDNGIGSYSSLVSLSIAFYPVLDPLPNFFIIGPYRKAIIGWLRGCLRNSPEPARKLTKSQTNGNTSEPH